MMIKGLINARLKLCKLKKIGCEVKTHPIFLLFEVYNFYIVFQGFVYRVISAAARSAVVIGK